VRYLLFLLIFVFSLLQGCSSSEETSKLVGLDLVHLNDGPPKLVKDYFENKIKEGDGGLHIYHHDGKSYLVLLEQNRMISSIQELTDYARVITSSATNEGSPIVYVTVIDELKKPMGVFREEDLKIR